MVCQRLDGYLVSVLFNGRRDHNIREDTQLLEKWIDRLSILQNGRNDAFGRICRVEGPPKIPRVLKVHCSHSFLEAISGPANE